MRTAVIGGVAALVAGLVVATTGGAGVATAAGAKREPVVGPAVFNPAFTHGLVPVNGAVLHYVKGGSGPVMVLLHGWPETWLEWRKTMPELARKHTVIAFDLPGLGDSSHPTSGFDAVSTAARIRQAVQRLGYNQIDLLSHDVGTLVAYAYARDFPTEVKHLVAMETPLNGFGLENLYSLSFHFLFNMSPAPIPETILDTADVPTYLGMIYDFTVDHASIDRAPYFYSYSDPDDRHAGYEYYRAFPANAANNQANAGQRLPMPVLGMGGAFSFGPGVAGSFSQVADNVHTAVVPNAAHFLPEENPRFVLDCVALFVGDTAPSGSTAPELAGCAS